MGHVASNGSSDRKFSDMRNVQNDISSALTSLRIVLEGDLLLKNHILMSYGIHGWVTDNNPFLKNHILRSYITCGWISDEHVDNAVYGILDLAQRA